MTLATFDPGVFLPDTDTFLDKEHFMTSLRITATAHGVNYLPEYYARSQGLFADRGVEAVATARDPWDGVMHDLANGRADVALGGLWVPAMYADRGRDFVAFAQLNDRFPMTIVTRQEVPTFEWSWLSGKTVLVPGQGGTAPYEFTAGQLRRAGVDPGLTRFARDLSGGMLKELYLNGLGDAFVADPATAAELVLGGHGHASLSLADVGGVMPNSVYYVLRERLEELTPTLVPFTAAIQEAMHQLKGTAGADHIELFKNEWPDADVDVLVAATDELLSNGTWSGVRIARSGCDNWTGILHEAGLTVKPVAYEQIVTTTVVDEVGA